jgi:hypothetical protein
MTSPVYNVKIPRVVMQTSKEKPSEFHAQFIMRHSPNWKYVHFDDDEMMRFIEKHPMPEFPKFAEKIREIPRGCHRADLFRYLYLYHYGGVFIDYDAMIYQPMDHIAKHHTFFTVVSGMCPQSVFQGLLGVVPYHPLIYLALYDAYHIDIRRLANHVELCDNMYKMIQSNKWMLSAFLYQEQIHSRVVCHTVDLNDPTKILLLHFFHYKRIDYDYEPNKIPAEPFPLKTE